MALKRLIMTAILSSWTSTTLAYPQAGYLGGTQKISPPSSSSIFQPIPATNGTNAPPPPVGAIQCFRPSQLHRVTDIDGCRPTLNYFRSYPNYRLVQDFLEDRYPKLPHKPPYAIHHLDSNCVVQIASRNPFVVDKFSFEQARALATEILEVCKDRGGLGGYSPLGRGVGWNVVVVGFTDPPDPPDLPDLLEVVGSGNRTSVPARLVEA